MITVVASLIAAALLIFILAPFWLGDGGFLVPSSQISDRSQLAKLKTIILKRYLQDEAAASQGNITKSEWQKRQQFLTNRYIDLVRRCDYLEHMQASDAAQALGVINASNK